MSSIKITSSVNGVVTKVIEKEVSNEQIIKVKNFFEKINSKTKRWQGSKVVNKTVK